MPEIKLPANMAKDKMQMCHNSPIFVSLFSASLPLCTHRAYDDSFFSFFLSFDVFSHFCAFAIPIQSSV